MLSPKLVLPTPGGPTKHKIGKGKLQFDEVIAWKKECTYAEVEEVMFDLAVWAVNTLELRCGWLLDATDCPHAHIEFFRILWSSSKKVAHHWSYIAHYELDENIDFC